MTANDKSARSAELHTRGKHLVLYNVWDAGSAKAVAEAGAPAIATSSWSVAEAQGFRDGEGIPFVFAARFIGASRSQTRVASGGSGTGSSISTSQIHRPR
jgi:2-methylisocitrate lyase-like PEP mutase family enzyme